mmetsp:Transcript_14227/g.36516  ORF Transcript_14227/g.36516 Transcript_14227/m.36516 type:complete len:321 (+) Transcript_14227:689-1651(+)
MASASRSMRLCHRSAGSAWKRRTPAASAAPTSFLVFSPMPWMLRPMEGMLALPPCSCITRGGASTRLRWQRPQLMRHPLLMSVTWLVQNLRTALTLHLSGLLSAHVSSRPSSGASSAAMTAGAGSSRGVAAFFLAAFPCRRARGANQSASGRCSRGGSGGVSLSGPENQPTTAASTSGASHTDQGSSMHRLQERPHTTPISHGYSMHSPLRAQCGHMLFQSPQCSISPGAATSSPTSSWTDATLSPRMRFTCALCLFTRSLYSTSKSTGSSRAGSYTGSTPLMRRSLPSPRPSSSMLCQEKISAILATRRSTAGCALRHR